MVEVIAEVSDGFFQIIVLKRQDGKFQDYYYNGAEGRFKQLSQPWPEEDGTFQEHWDDNDFDLCVPPILEGVLVPEPIPLDEIAIK